MFRRYLPSLPSVNLPHWCLCLLFLLCTTVIGPLAAMTYPLFAVCRLVLGTLYPAYASYKAVRTKNVREYVSINPYLLSYLLLCAELQFAKCRDRIP